MARKDISATWDRNNRNSQNDNFKELYDNVDNIAEKITTEVFNDIVDSAKLEWGSPVDTPADLPLGSPDGEARMVRDTGDVYRFNGEAWDVIQEINVTPINALESRFAKDIHYSEVTYDKYYDEISQTTYFITFIPYLDSEGNVIKIRHGFPGKSFNNGVETARKFSNESNLTFAANASVFNMDTGSLIGIQMQDGIILQEEADLNNYALGIKADNTLVAYSPEVTAQQMMEEGVSDALTGFFPMVEEGSPVDPSIYESVLNTSQPNPRQVIAQKENKDILFITTQGRDVGGKGMTYDDLIRISLNHGASFAYCLDGGGSTQTVTRGALVNNPIGGDERKVADFLYVKKDSPYPNKLKSLNYDLGKISKSLSDLSGDLGVFGEFGEISNNVGDLNRLTESGMYWAGSSTLNKPTSYSGGVIHFQAGVSSALQMIIPFHGSLEEIKFRRTVTDMTTWTGWRGTYGNLEWSDLNLRNGWVNSGGSEPTARYTKRNGVVYVRGTIKDGVTDGGTVLFNLPVGYRPSERVPVITMSDTGSGREMTRLFVNANGDVTFINGGNRWLYTCFNFPIDS